MLSLFTAGLEHVVGSPTPNFLRFGSAAGSRTLSIALPGSSGFCSMLSFTSLSLPHLFSLYPPLSSVFLNPPSPIPGRRSRSPSILTLVLGRGFCSLKGSFFLDMFGNGLLGNALGTLSLLF